MALQGRTSIGPLLQGITLIGTATRGRASIGPELQGCTLIGLALQEAHVDWSGASGAHA